ncbi:hypothetical protein GCM10025868_21780 [Angustibacter aerolatus]|uniref:OmpR/PhoB-type domain-containing protein n=1 Tax=Angustibacter aerolatus TaxID=1162965 RepID=A0ABQ6JHQ7_9ACTN|nr:winged helix-turn-helix domain-containing protein [Angustibacter aerolatus]GMA86928.1 hypothetical protein GCM10025868_21780 [Angustibacter aerolatus]
MRATQPSPPGEPPVRVRLLGAVEVVGVDGRSVPAGPPLQQAVLACLAGEPGRVWSSAQLVDAVWGEQPPARPEASLSTYVWGLRRLLGADAIVRTSTGGYVLQVDGPGSDVVAARDAGQEASRLVSTGEPERAAEVLAAALGAWRAEALLTVPGPGADLQRTGLHALRVSLSEQAGRSAARPAAARGRRGRRAGRRARRPAAGAGRRACW